MISCYKWTFVKLKIRYSIYAKKQLESCHKFIDWSLEYFPVVKTSFLDIGYSIKDIVKTTFANNYYNKMVFKILDLFMVIKEIFTIPYFFIHVRRIK